MACPITDFSKMLLKILVHEKVPKTMRRQKLSETICHIWKIDFTEVLLNIHLLDGLNVSFFHYTVLYTILYYTLLYYAVLYTMLCYAILYYTILYYTILYYSF